MGLQLEGYMIHAVVTPPSRPAHLRRTSPCLQELRQSSLSSPRGRSPAQQGQRQAKRRPHPLCYGNQDHAPSP
ncbi:hypothetical protein AAFF_G00068320 [Aldrovandia affinis]|uniref:Uncharacterized protein n=1 Tax=Aldrovandia affinis TaxID=143900 RepID=A0AAD7WEM3_9TELE|nr:hypothetical protein AAFF_G00068320 [Aldrovandia affinis]